MIKVFKTIRSYFKEFKCFSPESFKFAPISKERLSISRIIKTGTSANSAINSSSNVFYYIFHS